MLRRFFLLVYMMRVPLLILAVLGIGLPLTVQSTSTMFRGVADLQSNQVIVAAFLAFLLLSEAITCAFLILLYGEERADGWQAGTPADGRVSTPKVVLLYGGAGVCYVVLLDSLRRFMQEANPQTPISNARFVAFATAGLLGGTLIVLLIFLLVLYFAKPEDDSAVEVFAFPIFLILKRIGWIERRIQAAKKRPADPVGLGSYASHRGFFSSLLARLLGPGYGTQPVGNQPVTLHAGHRFALILMFSLFGFYVLTGRSVFHELQQPGPWSHGFLDTSVLNYLLLLAMFWCSLLSGLTFFFDRFRVPALLALALLLYCLSFLGPSDHTFGTVPRSKHASALLSPQEALDRAFRRGSDSVIVVAAAGGGIQSAAWTSQVLCSLRRAFPAFAEHVAVISSVSGGSVGTMFYLRRLDEPPNHKPDFAEQAEESSLEAVAWGLTHPDLRRAFAPWLFSDWSRADRGWALEKALLKNAQFNSSDDRQLTGDHSVGAWPVLLLNSTNAKTGDPVVFTNSDFPVDDGSAVTDKSPRFHRLYNFHSVCADSDVELETAIRMSAAFSYVSPVARCDRPSGAEHLADGGYFDNSGLFVLSEWLKTATQPASTNGAASAPSQPHKQILLLQLDAFPDSEPALQEAAQKWYYQILAPIEAMLNVRSEGQVLRDLTSGEDLKELLAGRGYTTIWTLVRYNTEAQNMTGYKCPDRPPLSWHLTPLEKLCIDKAWNIVSPLVKLEVDRFLSKETPKVPAEAVTANDSDDAKKKAPVYVQRSAAR